MLLYGNRKETTMERKIRRDARLAAPLRDHSPAPRSAAVLAADTRR